jgi:hypothetical protein
MCVPKILFVFLFYLGTSAHLLSDVGREAHNKRDLKFPYWLWNALESSDDVRQKSPSFTIMIVP